MKENKKKAIEQIKSILKSEGIEMREASDKDKKKYQRKLEQMEERLQAAWEAEISSIPAQS